MINIKPPAPNGTTSASQKAIVLNREGKMLTIFRTGTAPTRPNTWDLPGGDLDLGEDAIASIAREITEEAGLKVTNVRPFDVESLISPEGTFWITIAYYAQTSDDKVTLGYEHNDYRWVTITEFLEINTSNRAKRFIESLLQLEAVPRMRR
jgi:8-oxo-dGTP diphosphatase